MSTKRALLYPDLPFNFDLTFEATPPAYPSVYSKGVLKRCVKLKSGKIVPVIVKNLGKPHSPKIEIVVHSRISENDFLEVKKSLAHFLCLNDSLMCAYEIMERHAVLRKIKDVLYGVKPWTTFTPIEGLFNSIIFQQISIWAAFSIIREFVKRFGERVFAFGEELYTYPSPDKIARATTAELKACKLSGNKAIYIKNLAEKILTNDIDIEWLLRASSEKAVEELMNLKGFGRWTAEIALATGFKKWDVIPADDLGIKRAFSRLIFGKSHIESEEIRRYARNWGNYKWPIAYYLLCYNERIDRLLRNSK